MIRKKSHTKKKAIEKHNHQDHSKISRFLENVDENTVRDVKNGQLFRLIQKKDGTRLLPIWERMIDWSSSYGFVAIQLLIECLSTSFKYQLWDKDTNAPMTQEKWMKKKYKDNGEKVWIRHTLCEMICDVNITNLKQGKGIKCFCSGRLAISDPEYYRCMSSKIICNQLGVYRAFHTDVNPLQLPSKDEFCYVNSNTDKLSLKCSTCKVVADDVVVLRPALNHIQGNRGMACFCSVMKPTNPYYYDFILNKQLCLKLNKFTAFHRESDALQLPSKKVFYESVSVKGAHSKVRDVRCTTCGVYSSNTTLNSLEQNGGIACFCNGSLRLTDPQYYECMCNPFLCNYLGCFAAFHATGQFEIPTQVVFLESISNMSSSNRSLNTAILKCKCNSCGNVNKTTTIGHLRQGGGCSTCNSHVSFKDRYQEIVHFGMTNKLYKMLTTEDEWHMNCKNSSYKPTVECYKCGAIVNSTVVQSLLIGTLGCFCRNKTEGKFYEWLCHMFPNANVYKQFRGPKLKGHTHFDFLITFPDDLKVIIELDGIQHFWVNSKFYNFEGCERDVQKEKWAITNGISVIRVLQKDVWDDLFDWQGWVLRCIDESRRDVARVRVPDAPEYRSLESMYVMLRHKSNE